MLALVLALVLAVVFERSCREARLRAAMMLGVAATDPTFAYTDGACSGNPGPGGWAWIVPDGPFAAGFAPQSTNQRMEIEAAFEAVKTVTGRLEIVSDSTYVVNCFRDRWWEGWIKKGWKNSQRKPVANRDLWEPFIELVVDRGDVTFRWVKGHAGNEWNDLADRLAVEACHTQRPRIGPETPTDVGAPDRVAPRSTAGTAVGRERQPTASERPYAGHAIGVFGHRPTELGGYDNDEIANRVRRRLVEILVSKRELDEDLVVVSGLRLGAEQLGAEAAIEAGVPLAAILPYPEPDSVWPQESRRKFAELMSAARDTKTLERKAPSSKQRAGAALARRDAWFARHLDEAIVIWDRKDPAIGKLVRSLEGHLGDDVWLLDPGQA